MYLLVGGNWLVKTWSRFLFSWLNILYVLVFQWFNYLITWIRCGIWILFSLWTWVAMHEVVVSTLLPICDFYVLYVGSVCLAWRALGGIKCCVRFSVPRSPVETLSPVWINGKGSSSPVWSSGRGLVRVFYPLACVKQWGGERCFHLILARCKFSARCAMHWRFYS